MAHRIGEQREKRIDVLTAATTFGCDVLCEPVLQANQRSADVSHPDDWQAAGIVAKGDLKPWNSNLTNDIAQNQVTQNSESSAACQ